jgi:protein AFG1
MIEMTTSPTYRNEQWIPLDSTARAWETPSQPSTPRTSAKVLARVASAVPGSVGDFAEEAGYSRPQLLQPRATTGPREGAPVIKEHHMWGVTEEWGDRAGKWGKGVKAFDDDKGEKK